MKRSVRRACMCVMRDIFGMEAFRPGQEAAVNALLSGRDLLCILPTGYGKSLCWQVPSLVHEGLTVVISPLIALMHDQVQHLRSLGVQAEMLSSLMTREEQSAAIRAVMARRAGIVYVSPERLASPAFVELCMARPPWMVVVDEAHCIVQWGESFRPAYGLIGEFIGRLSRKPVICAMTATADDDMQREIVSSLGMRRHRRVMLPVFRQNLHYRSMTAANRSREIATLLQRSPGKAVVFCRTRARTEALGRYLRAAGISARHYHAGLTRDERETLHQLFQTGQLQVLTATTAFGMGVDIPDIRCVIHDYLPGSIIDYLQQSGRAGRDGLEAECILLLAPEDFLGIGRRLFKPYGRLMSSRFSTVLCAAFIWRQWLPVKRVLQVFMTRRCITEAAARQLGQRVRPCGVCSACTSGPLRRRLPPLYDMHPEGIRRWMLKWQREKIADLLGCRPKDVLSGPDLSFAARQMWLRHPHQRGAADLERLLVQFRRIEAAERGINTDAPVMAVSTEGGVLAEGGGLADVMSPSPRQWFVHPDTVSDTIEGGINDDEAYDDPAAGGHDVPAGSPGHGRGV